MLRWVSPIKNMARTTTVDVELEGVTVRAGSKVVVLYESANFDDRHFAEPERFDIERSPNDHLAFGFGPHFCLGASLARVELPAMFERLLQRLPDLRARDGSAAPAFDHRHRADAGRLLAVPARSCGRVEHTGGRRCFWRSTMKVRVDDTLCQGHGRCYALAPELFEPDDIGNGQRDR